MLRPSDFILYIKSAEADRVLLARVALNVLYDPALYPVDLSAVLALRGMSRAMVKSLLDWCATEPSEHTGSPDCTFVELIALADPREGSLRA
jgi:hypothetical protein